MHLVNTLLSHQWKSFRRSRSAGKDLIVQILLGLCLLYFIAIAIFTGLFLKTFIQGIYPGQNTVPGFCGLLLYYFIIDLLVRFFLQKLPTLAIYPYLILPISRKQLIRFLNIRSLFSFFNFLPLLLFVPFILTVICAGYGIGVGASFLVCIVFMIAFNHFIVLYLKRKIIISGWLMVALFVIIISLGICDYYQVFSLRHISSVLFIQLLFHPSLCLIIVLLAALVFINNNQFLKNHLYLEDTTEKQRSHKGSNYAFMERFKTTGGLISLDIKLIFRNRLPRSSFWGAGILLLYGLVMYKPASLARDSLYIPILVGILITGTFILTYGQNLFAWQSSCFDGLMTGNIQIRAYIKSKFVLLNAASTIILLISSLYGLMSWKLIPLQIAAFCYNIGLNTVMMGYFATRNYKSVDLGKGARFNYQGFAVIRLFAILIILLVPAAIYFPFEMILGKWAGVIAIGTVGLISFLLQDKWIDFLTNEFIKRKYTILEGFREK